MTHTDEATERGPGRPEVSPVPRSRTLFRLSLLLSAAALPAGLLALHYYLTGDGPRWWPPAMLLLVAAGSVVAAVVLAHRRAGHTMRTQLSLAFVIASLAPLGLLGLASQLATQQGLTEQVGANLALLAETANHRLTAVVQNGVGVAQSTASLEAIGKAGIERLASYTGHPEAVRRRLRALDAYWATAPNGDPLVRGAVSRDFQVNPVTFQLVDVTRSFPSLSRIEVFDGYGALLAATDRPDRFYAGDEPWWQELRAGAGRRVFITAERTDRPGVTQLTIVIPLRTRVTGTFIGALRATWNDTGALRNVVAQTRVGKTGRMFVLDAAGRVLLDSLPADDPEAAVHLPTDVLRRLTGSPPGYFVAPDSAGESSMFASASLDHDLPLPGEDSVDTEVERAIATLGWRTVIQQKATEATAVAAGVQHMTTVAGMAALALALGIAAFFAQSLTRPLTRLAEAAEQMGGGNLQVDLSPSDTTEISRLTNSFAAMAARLRDILADLERRVEERTVELRESTAQLAAQHTELMRSHARLQESNAKLEEAYARLTEDQQKLLISEKMASLGRLAAGVAHEMNSPLAAVRAALRELEKLVDEYSDSVNDPAVTPTDHREIAADMRAAIDLAAGAAERAAAFLRGMKTQTRDLEEGETVRFKAVPVVRESLLLLSHALRRRRCVVHLQVDSEDVELVGSPGRLAQVVTNLVNNAIDAADPEQGETAITLSLAVADGMVQLQVADTGRGIPLEIINRIFDPMFSTKPFGEGTGLGLTIVHDIVTGEFGGTIAVQSEPGRGTTFTLSFPRRDPNPRAMAAPGGPGPV